jgi:hypothetical protein
MKQVLIAGGCAAAVVSVLASFWFGSSVNFGPCGPQNLLTGCVLIASLPGILIAHTVAGPQSPDNVLPIAMIGGNLVAYFALAFVLLTFFGKRNNNGEPVRKVSSLKYYDGEE